MRWTELAPSLPVQPLEALAEREPALAARGAAPPRRLLEALPELRSRLAGLARVRSEHASEDGSRRLLVELADGATVESRSRGSGGRQTVTLGAASADSVVITKGLDEGAVVALGPQGNGR
jgi:hypothetical protein